MELSHPIKMTLGLFPLGAFAALVVWFIYVGKYGQYGNQIGSDGQTNKDNSDIAFQAVIASVAVYYVLHHHMSHMM